MTAVGVVIVAIAIVVAPAVHLAHRASTYDGWLRDMRRPGWRLLASERSDLGWFAVFDAGGSQLGLCSHWLGDGEGGITYGSYLVVDEQGQDVRDSRAPNRSHELDRVSDTRLSSYAEPRDAVMYPVRLPATGRVRVMIDGAFDRVVTIGAAAR